MKCSMCKMEVKILNEMVCELCYSQCCMDDDGSPIRDIKPAKGKQ